jgi:hypothetical protein
MRFEKRWITEEELEDLKKQGEPILEVDECLDVNLESANNLDEILENRNKTRHQSLQKYKIML